MSVSESQPVSVGDLKHLVENGLGGGSFSTMTRPCPAAPPRRSTR